MEYGASGPCCQKDRLDTPPEDRYSPAVDIRYLLFDLDQTLYPASAGLLAEVDRRITAYTASFLGVDLAKAALLRKGLYNEHGTTLKGLIAEHGFDKVDDYLAMVHPENVGDFLSPDPGLDGMLARLPQGKSILTNSPGDHAERVLAVLGIRRRFDHVFDIKYNGYTGKPAPSCYRNAVKAVGGKIGEVLFLDDSIPYLTAFRDLGGQALLVAEDGCGGRDTRGLPWIRTVKDLPAWLEAAG